MPYKIKKTKEGLFSVVNKDTGRVLSKGTTEDKAKRQIRAIYSNTDENPESKIRFHISNLKHRNIKNPLHKKIVDFTKEMLKEEEKVGAGFWDDAWTGIKNVMSFPSQAVNEIPYLGDAITAIAPELKPAFEFTPAIAKYIYGDETNLWLSDMLSNTPVGDIRSDKSYLTTEQYNALHGDKSIQQIQPIQEQQIEKARNNKEHTIDLAKTIEHIDLSTPQFSDTPYTPYEVPRYSPLSYDIEGNIIPVDDALRFPMIYDYSPNDIPLTLAQNLINNGVAGKNFAKREFGDVVKNQKPYAFLDFPLNKGGNKNIDFSKYVY